MVEIRELVIKTEISSGEEKSGADKKELTRLRLQILEEMKKMMKDKKKQYLR